MAKKSEHHRNIHLFAATVFGIVTLVHAIRIANGIPVMFGTWQAPMWISWLAIFVAGWLSVTLWRSSK